jgi:CheY-like chemotaxis protein
MAGKKVLVIEDDVECAEAYQALLEPNYEITLAHDGSRALDLLESGTKFDLVILDIMMPAGERIQTKDVGLTTGLELLKEIRGKKNDIAVIIISVVWDQEVTSRMRDLGARAILQKPLRPPHKLVETVNEILG